MTQLRRLLIATVLISGMLFPLVAGAAEALVQVATNVFMAKAGGTGTGTTNSALITVVLTQAGAPIAKAGANVGNGTGKIGLPPGWSLTTVTYPANAALLMPTQFINQGNGVYVIRVVPNTSAFLSPWRAGDYNFAVRVSLNSGSTKGSGLGILKVQ